MRYILGPRGSGKTTELIKLSAEYGYIIACPNADRVSQLRKAADKLRLKIPSPITYDRLMNGFGRGSWLAAVMIDDLELFFMSIIPHMPVIAVTSTPDGVKFLDNPQKNLLDNLLHGYANELDDV